MSAFFIGFIAGALFICVLVSVIFTLTERAAKAECKQDGWDNYLEGEEDE